MRRGWRGAMALTALGNHLATNARCLAESASTAVDISVTTREVLAQMAAAGARPAFGLLCPRPPEKHAQVRTHLCRMHTA